MARSWYNQLLYIIFIILGIIVYFYPIYLFFNIQFLFVSVFYLTSIRLFGYRKALFTVGLYVLIGVWMNVHPVYLSLMVLEVIVVGGLYRSYGKSMLSWDALFWLILTIPVYFLLPTVIMPGLESEITVLLTLKLLINVLLNALIADIISEYLPALPVMKNILSTSPRLHLSKIMTHISLCAAIIPLFYYTIFNGNYEESKIVDYYKMKIDSYTNQITNKLTELDYQEVQQLKLGSVVQKGVLKELFDSITDVTTASIYVVDRYNQIYVASGVDTQTTQSFTLFDNGYQAEIANKFNIWMPSQAVTVYTWSEGYFYSQINLHDLTFFVIIPLKNELVSLANKFSDYFKIILSLFGLIYLFTFLCEYILSKSLTRLITLATNIPTRIQKNQLITWEKSTIQEFNFLGTNIEAIAQKLKEMFQEAREQNELLTNRTEQLISSREKLYQLAHFDILTGIPNRQKFQKDLQKLMTELDQKSNRSQFALLFIDIDKFKQVNDQYGHFGGDELLVQFAEKVRAFLIDYENVALYRLGGDEFVIINKETNSQEIRNFCEKLIQVVKQPVTIHQTITTISISIGVSFYPEDGTNVEELMNNADTAMYEVKSSGRDGVKLFSDGEEKM
ncbi:GGDEF domain-containing protein [Aquibacillus salsiterrae]|uniref:GGDEF domain-containing protein n=1 Tax=Aquibacillus salsiterrae TaxID=2950439 RepID=A0A9X3WD22_9BACI|nr:GGDEF domain-containing protein [Aquibacillus salsiterrae]MDC3415815.1 GGDEF domain-containing protein [Aquibacillus salsiterrae]